MLRIKLTWKFLPVSDMSWYSAYISTLFSSPPEAHLPRAFVVVSRLGSRLLLWASALHKRVTDCFYLHRSGISPYREIYLWCQRGIQSGACVWCPSRCTTEPANGTGVSLPSNPKLGRDYSSLFLSLSCKYNKKVLFVILWAFCPLNLEAFFLFFFNWQRALSSCTMHVSFHSPKNKILMLLYWTSGLFTLVVCAKYLTDCFK